MNHDTSEPDRTAELAALWPYDGPHSAESVTQAAEGISQLARYIANATQAGRRYPYMSTVGNVAGSLALACDRLDQVLNQMNTAVAAHDQTGELYDDRDPEQPGRATAQAVSAHIEQTRDAADALARRLTEVATNANHIGHR